MIMASKSMFICLALLVVFCFIMKQSSTDCDINGYKGCFLEKKDGFSEGFNRKVLDGLKEMKKYSIGNVKRELYEWELRKVPSGPDPLHHNGKNPKKPRSP